MTATRYTPLRSLGVGALSEAHLARDAAGRLVVVKRIHRHCASDPELAAMFEHEATLSSLFDHPGLVRSTERGVDERGRFFVQEYVPGVALAEVIAGGHGPLPLAAGVAVVQQLLAALDYVHTLAVEGEPQRIVHRDVCPANVLVTRRGAVKLIDFGIATSVARPDHERGRLKGTRGYMAPEVVTGESEADARSDLFAVGVILYELTTGRRLYEGPTLRVLAAIADGPLPSPMDAAPGYPKVLHDVVQRALARSPESRYPDARAMLRELDDARRALALDASREAVARALDATFRAHPPEAPDEPAATRGSS